MHEIILTHDQFDSLSHTVIKAGGSLCFEAHGCSMHPFLQHNDVITVRPADDAELVPGAIVLCRLAHDRLVVHRIAARGRMGSPGDYILMIRGDANPNESELVAMDNVLGIISRVERGSRAFRVDRGPWLLVGRMAAKYSNLLPWITAPGKLVRQIASRFVRRMQGLMLYRSILRGIVAHKVAYGISSRAVLKKALGECLSSLSEGELALQKVFTESDSCFGKNYVISAALRKRQIGQVELTDHFGDLDQNSGWWLIGLMVSPLLRGAGIGEQLARRAIELAHSKGTHRVSVLINDRNHRARALYTKLGFHDVPEALHTAPMEALLKAEDERFRVMSVSLK